MPEDDGYHTVVSYNSMRFREGTRDHLVVVGRCPVVNVATALNNGFLVFLLDTMGVGGECKPGCGRDQRTLEPDKEQVRSIGVIDHVVIWGIGDDR
jgi:hypothetical protein